MKSLKITDLRIAVIKDAPMTCPIIRIETNQEGLYGLGEVRDGASKTFALFLKSRLLGENPLDVDRLFRKIKPFGFHGRQGGGVCGVEMALWDIVGKYYGVPVYQLIGGKFRDKIRVYADTDMDADPAVTASRLMERIEQGFTFLKMDFMGTSRSKNTVRFLHGEVPPPPGMTLKDVINTQHMFTGMELSASAIATIAEYVAEVRRIVGYDTPLAADHFGHIGVNSCIRLGKALEPFTLAWLEDLIPWQHTDLWKRITDAVDLPTCTGEDIYLKEGFVELCKHHAVDIIHPDLATSGGILETKKIGDIAQDWGVPMAMHFAGTPISCMANVHCAAATENFLVLENHSVDIDWWSDLVVGIDKPIVQNGFITVPDTPGLGITLNEEVVKEHLLDGSLFEPSTEWDTE
ncbi:MAG: mandelate racemase/muconate lactonizing enzyme family protein, partial [Armatimonadetes bacterium]|nr:mandelate racemase/muconate lactonizing enzyme family protein [Armatimonadota bacterium]